jgi:hypothetical protein
MTGAGLERSLSPPIGTTTNPGQQPSSTEPMIDDLAFGQELSGA